VAADAEDLRLFECEHAPEACRPLRITAHGCLGRQKAARKGGLLRNPRRTITLDTAACLKCETGKAIRIAHA
jgi:hypothetical protein